MGARRAGAPPSVKLSVDKSRHPHLPRRKVWLCLVLFVLLVCGGRPCTGVSVGRTPSFGQQWHCCRSVKAP